MRGIVSKNKSNIVFLVFSIILIAVLIYSNIFIINRDTTPDDNFNILTISSIFSGFLFTGLGVLIAGLDNSRIKRLQQWGYMDKYFNSIYITIALNIICMISTLIIIYMNAHHIFNDIQQISFVLSILFFAKSMNDIRRIIGKLRNSIGQ